MNTFTYVEDYLEYLAGYDPSNAITQWITPHANDQIRLARYDVSIVESMSNNTMFGTALTDRQAELVVKLVVKYRRQFAKCGIDVSPIEDNPQYRMPVRKIDRSKRIWIEDGKLKLRFPYNTDMINDVREYTKDAMGSAKFDNNDKTWNFGLTEQHVNWLVAWSSIYQIEVDADVEALFKLILICEQTPYELKLYKNDTEFYITNAADSLVDYINTQLGGFGLDNADRLIDYAGVLGYDIDELIEVKPLVKFFGLKRNYQLEPIPENVISVLEYAEQANRFPVMIYHPAGPIGNALDMDILREMFQPHEIVHINLDGHIPACSEPIENAKVIYVEKFPKTMMLERIPLLVTYQELLHGSNKQQWLNAAERIVYLCNTTLRKK